MAENWDNLSAPLGQPQPLQDHWERKLQHARQVPPAGLLLGTILEPLCQYSLHPSCFQPIFTS